MDNCCECKTGDPISISSGLRNLHLRANIVEQSGIEKKHDSPSVSHPSLPTRKVQCGSSPCISRRDTLKNGLLQTEKEFIIHRTK